MATCSLTTRVLSLCPFGEMGGWSRAERESATHRCFHRRVAEPAATLSLCISPVVIFGCCSDDAPSTEGRRLVRLPPPLLVPACHVELISRLRAPRALVNALYIYVIM